MSTRPRITLVSFTQHPVEVMLYAYKNMNGAIPDTLEEFMASPNLTEQVKKDFVVFLGNSMLGGVQEFVSTVWCLKNVSRAFQQQLTRHRTAAYSIQSLRVVDKKKFATSKDFHTPSNAVSPLYFGQVMANIERQYRMLIEKGERVEVARGILPLNIKSPITMSINLRNLITLISTRLCRMVQGEFREVATLMIQEVTTKMGEDFRQLFHAPCDKTGMCPFAEGCGFRPKLLTSEGKYTEVLKAFVTEL